MRLKLATLRRLRGWTQEDLAQATGFDRGTVAKHEAGLRGWNTSTLERYAAAFGCEEWEVLGYSAPPDDELDEETRGSVSLLLTLPPDRRRLAKRTLMAMKEE